MISLGYILCDIDNYGYDNLIGNYESHSFEILKISIFYVKRFNGKKKNHLSPLLYHFHFLEDHVIQIP